MGFYDSEIFMDVRLNHYPLRDYKDMWAEMSSIVKSYAKIGKRNEKAIQKNKLGKHMMHLVRLYLMCLDILEKEKNISKDVMLEAIENSLLSACKNHFGTSDNIKIVMDRNT